jgi:hypothetical protein
MESRAIVIRYLFWLWFFAAVAVGHFRWLERLPIPAIQAVILGLTALLLFAYFRINAFGAWVNALELRSLVLFHVTRFVGFYFLHLHALGELPYDFAVPAGYGDIIVAFLALLVVFLPMDDAKRRRAISIWNVVGFIDILLVVFTAAKLARTDPLSLRPLTHLPLSLLPTLLVPLIIASHLVIFARLRREQPPM